MAFFMGIDIGSGTSKGAVTEDGKLLAYHLLPTGLSYRKTEERLIEELLAKVNLSPQDIAFTVAIGHGQGSNIPFRSHEVADTRCCARGINSLFPSVRTVIDFQRLSSHVIRLNGEGEVTNYAISEPCSEGSGVFIETMANALHIEVKDIGPLTLSSENPVSFSSECPLDCKPAIASHLSGGTSKADIMAGVHKILAHKISHWAGRVGLEEPCAISGGGALNVGLIKSIEEKLGVQLLVPSQPQVITALGAALIAEEWGRR